MRNLNETNVLNYYLQLIEKEEVSFLKGRAHYTEAVKEAVVALRDAEGMNNRINAAKNAWKLLFEASMSHIDPDKRGYDKLFKYFDEYVNFEELIFASDSFYRDHTLHSLWVYFLGEYVITHKEFEGFFHKMFEGRIHMESIRDMLISLNMPHIFGKIIGIYEEILKVSALNDAIRCVSALSHDLGYPLKKIEKINKCIKEIMPYFSINNYDEFNFNFSEVQQHFVASFLEFLSTRVTPSSSEDDIEEDFVRRVFELNEVNEITSFKKEEILKLTKEELQMVKKILTLIPKISKNMTRYWAYCKDFEDYKHGIMSAFLLVKNVNAFHDIEFSIVDNIHSDFAFIDFKDIFAKQAVLLSVTDHTCDNFKISQLNDSVAFLTFIDELEEFSRISRANQSREYITEFCNTDLYMEDGWFNIDFLFENTDIANLDPQRAFKGRCNRFLNLFDIGNLAPEMKIRLKCISRLPNDGNTYTLELANKYAKIMINDEEKNIPKYLGSKQLYSREEYAQM